MNKDNTNLYKCYILESAFSKVKYTHKHNGQPVCPRCPKENACNNCPNVVPALADLANMQYVPNDNPPYAVGYTHNGNELRLQIEDGRLVLIKNGATIGHMRIRDWMNPTFINQLKERIKSSNNENN